ncbi:hypothetical protein [Oceanobacter antarcticus]|uniref:CheC, inhibitor of MCP methylation n=1 Tax=Oceanobacter antarcticus TaxID=3133425 RepID=A0ABW8NF39_9GAMM
MILDEQARTISLDVLAESLNLGLGHVIDELSEISNSRIELHVPEVNMLPKKEALAFTEQLRQEGKAIFVQQRFCGEICGEALLFFSERESLNLLNGLLGEQEQTRIEFAVTEEEMLLDLTNVAVSGVIYALAQLLGIQIHTELPRCEYGNFSDSGRLLDETDNLILFLTISFTVVEKNSQAQLMFFQPTDALVTLFDHINKRLAAF